MAASRTIGRRGFTLLEAAITVAILGLVSSYVVLATRSGRSTFESTSSSTELESRLRRAIDRVAAELLTAGEGELIPNPTGNFGTADLLYRRAIDLNGTLIVWSDQDRLVLEYDAGEADNGLDDDGDGLVDEGVLVLVRKDGQLDELRIVLCHGVTELGDGEEANGLDDDGDGVVDEAGFNIHRTGDVLFLRLTAQDVVVETGDVLTRTLQTSVRLRN